MEKNKSNIIEPIPMSILSNIKSVAPNSNSINFSQASRKISGKISRDEIADRFEKRLSGISIDAATFSIGACV